MQEILELEFFRSFLLNLLSRNYFVNVFPFWIWQGKEVNLFQPAREFLPLIDEVHKPFQFTYQFRDNVSTYFLIIYVSYAGF